MNDKKKKSGNVGFIVELDSESGEYEDYFWSNEDHDPPPLIKRKKKGGKEKNAPPS